MSSEQVKTEKPSVTAKVEKPAPLPDPPVDYQSFQDKLEDATPFAVEESPLPPVGELEEPSITVGSDLVPFVPPQVEDDEKQELPSPNTVLTSASVVRGENYAKALLACAPKVSVRVREEAMVSAIFEQAAILGIYDVTITHKADLKAPVVIRKRKTQ